MNILEKMPNWLRALILAAVLLSLLTLYASYGPGGRYIRAFAAEAPMYALRAIWPPLGNAVNDLPRQIAMARALQPVEVFVPPSVNAAGDLVPAHTERVWIDGSRSQR